MTVVDLLGRNAELAVVVLTGVVINLRLLMFSASIAPYFREFDPQGKTLSSYLLTDQAYALAASWYREADPDSTVRFGSSRPPCSPPSSSRRWSSPRGLRTSYLTVSASDGLSVAVGNERLLAGLVAAAAAWVTEDVFATIAAGRLTLWLLRFVV